MDLHAGRVRVNLRLLGRVHGARAGPADPLDALAVIDLMGLAPAPAELPAIVVLRNVVDAETRRVRPAALLGLALGAVVFAGLLAVL
jgi:hypothetical protein